MERSITSRNPSTQVVKLYGNSRPRKDPLCLPFPVDRTTWGRGNWFQKLRGSKQQRLSVYHILTLAKGAKVALNNQGGIFFAFWL